MANLIIILQLEKQLNDMEQLNNNLTEQSNAEQKKLEGESDMLEVAQQELSQANSEK